jgi:allantoin racemase
MKIRVIAPITNREFITTTPRIYAEKARPDTIISAVCLDQGPASVESFYEDVIAAPGVIARAVEAERDGVDAVIIDCMNDPGLEATREAVSIPVVGAAQASMMMASILAHKFSVVSTAARDVYPVELLIRRYGLKDKYASTRWVDIPVLDLGEDDDRLLAALTAASFEAIRQDGAHAIVFGCTGMKGMAGQLEENLKAQGLDAIVIDPSLAALKWAEMLVDLDMAQSRLSYPLLDAAVFTGLPASTSPVQELSGQNTIKPEIHVLVPVVTGYREENWLDANLREYASFAHPGTSVKQAAIQKGPTTIENEYAVAMAVPEMLRLTRAAQSSGASAVVIDCMCDPSLDAARELADIPVVGPSQSSAFVAASLAHKFSYLGTGSDSRHTYINQMEEYGLGSKLASVRTTGMCVEEVENEPEALFVALLREAEKAVQEDGAHSLVLGCTGMIGVARKLQDALLTRGIDVPVLEPPAVAIKMAEAFSDLGLTQSKSTYPLPPKKALKGYSELEI